MIEALGKAPTRTLTAPLRGTQALDSATFSATPRVSEALRDQSALVSGKGRLQALADEESPAQVLKMAIYGLMQSPSLTMPERKVLSQMLAKVEQGLQAGDGASLRESLEFLRDKLNWRQYMDAQRQAQRLKEEQAIQHAADVTWMLFYKSLQTYLDNLQAMAKVEASVTDRKLNEARSESKFADRLLTAAATLLPGQGLTLLSAMLNQKA